MADLSKLLEGAAEGLAAGLLGVISTALAGFKDIKDRLKALEDKLGTADPPTGLAGQYKELALSVAKIRRELDGWSDEAPEWAQRLMRKARASSVSNLDDLVAAEQRVDAKMQALAKLTKKLEDALEAHEDLVTRAEYEKDAKERAAEMSRVEKQLGESNGLLRGVLAALEFTDGPRKQ